MCPSGFQRSLNMNVERFKIDHRFRGPPRSGNGGYTCGRIARHLSGDVAVRLKAAPPLGVELRLESSEAQARLFHGDSLVAEARVTQLDLQAVPCPSRGVVEQAAKSYIGFKDHRLPGCFVCGPQRALGDGLCIFPGALDDTSTVAAPWTPDPSLAYDSGNVRSEFLWSALDCTGAFAFVPFPEDTVVVLGELAASVREPVQAGVCCTVLGWSLGAVGRKRLAGTAVYGPNDRLIALARAVWIEVPLSTWN